MPEKEGGELLQHLEAIENHNKYNQIETLYPETGPLRRELYPKHMEFFRQGKAYRERAAIAANRSSAMFTHIETDHATRQFSELLGEKDFYVRSWDGSSQCSRKASHVFLKNIAPMFLVRLATGDSFSCTKDHRLLTCEGWSSLSCVVHASSGLHCRRKPQGCLASYGKGDYLYDERFLTSQDIFRGRLPSRGDVRAHTLERLNILDEVERILQYNHAFGHAFPLATLDDPNTLSDLYELFPDPALRPGALLTSYEHQELLLFADECVQLRASQQDASRQLYEEHHWDEEKQYIDAEEMRAKLDTAVPKFLQSARLKSAGKSLKEFLEDTDHKPTYDCYIPFEHPELVGNDVIISIESLSYQLVMDITVEETHNYNSSGVWHHNSGKSFGIGGFETALHLTGRYPEWWAGKRFPRPTDIWSSSDTSETTRDIVQQIMLGNIGDFGSGLIPKDCILGIPTHRAGVPGAVDTVRIRHISGGTSTLGFKCFAKGTKVLLANGEEADVEDLRIGQRVKCANGCDESIVSLFTYWNAPCVTIETMACGPITITLNHKMFSSRGLLPAAELGLDDLLEIYINGKLSLSHIVSINKAQNQKVYCVEVENSHELVANNYRVSNSFDQGRKKFQGTAKDVCIAKDELVYMADSAPLPIQDVKPGMMVMSLSHSGELVPRRVTAAHRNGVKECIKITLVSGHELTLTPDHQIYYDYSSLRAVRADLSKEVLVEDLDGEVRVLNVATKENVGEREVYDISVEGEHRFFVNGILVSNCWLDEECPLDVYTECLTRLMTRDGIMICTFTPLNGLSDVVLLYLPEYAPNVTDVNSVRPYEDEGDDS